MFLFPLNFSEAKILAGKSTADALLFCIVHGAENAFQTDRL